MKPWKTENLRKNLRKTCRGWGLDKLKLRETGVNLSEIVKICWRLSASV